VRRARQERESGFALLLVFLMAAIIAISLYMELPRVAFQSQRQKEQMLMERGEQYKRAIGLFLRTNKNTRWPATIEELESYNNRRFLRHRYIDPMTGKDEWRLIHIVNGVLTDSILNKKKDQEQDHLAKNGSVMELAALTGPDASGQAGVSAVNRRRVSEGGAAPVGPDGQPILTAPPPGAPDFTGNGPPPFPGATGPTSAGFAGVSGFTGVTSATGVPPPLPGGPPSGIAGLLGIPTAPTGPTAGIVTTPGVPSPGGPQAGVTISPQAQAAAQNLIQGLLTSPRPGGMQGLPQGAGGGSSSAIGGSSAVGGGLGSGLPTVGGGTPSFPGTPGGPPGGFPGAPPAGFPGAPPGGFPGAPPAGFPGSGVAGGSGAIMGSGIAGVASKAEGESIMVYADRSDYSEWEFIYDPVKFAAPTNPNTGNPSATPAQQLGAALTSTNAMNQNGTPTANPGGIGIGAAGATGPGGALGASGATGGAPMGGSSGFGQAAGGGQGVRPGKAW
jgi:type II secretory pathway pseudopilin PulG